MPGFLSPFYPVGLSLLATNNPTITLSPRNIESLTTYNGQKVVVSATVEYDYFISSACGIFANLNSEFTNYNQINPNKYTIEILVPKSGTLVVTVHGYEYNETQGCAEHGSLPLRTASDSIEVIVYKTETPKRYSQSLYKKINLKNLLPTHLEFSETGEFIEVFQNFLNEMYFEYESLRTDNYTFTVNNDGTKNYFSTSADSSGNSVLISTSVSGTDMVPYKYRVQEIPKISIAEKIKRLSDLHDPDLIDISYINSLANYLGYNIDIFKNNLSSDALSEYDVNRYLRFIVSNLPHWNRIKSTKNAIKILLYSFGLVGDLLERWTSDDLTSSLYHPTSGGYSNDFLLWTYENSSNVLDEVFNKIEDIPENYFPTSHFKIVVNQTLSQETWINQIPNIINAIDGIRPINTVFEDVVVLLYGYTTNIYIVNGSVRKEILFSPQNTIMAS